MTPEPTRRVVRDADWIDREYGQEKWPAVGEMVEEELARGERELDRVVARVARREFLVGRDMLAPLPVVIAGQRLSAPGCIGFGAYQSAITELVIASCRVDTDVVVELGAGWGRNVLKIFAAGGPRDARYVSAEPTEAGRRVAARLAELEPALRLETVPFDFREPRLDLGPSKHAVVFTVFSVEQVADLEENALESIRSLASRVTCLHFEPIGWQGDPGAREEREYSERHDYNRNLVSLVESFADRGLIHDVALHRDVVGMNPVHAMSLLSWQSGPPE